MLFVARDDPLDTYLVHHPEAIFARPVEASVTDPGQPARARPRNCAARPPSSADRWQTPPCSAGRRLGQWRRSWPVTGCSAAGRRLVLDRSQPPRADIRSGGGQPITLVEAGTGRLLGTVDAATAPSTVHSRRGVSASGAVPRRRRTGPG